MKNGITYVDAAKFEQAIIESGAKSKEQAGFVKVGSFENGLFVYVAKTKRVARVDISGFSAEGIPGCRKLGADEAHGSVEWGIDFSLSEEEILSGFKQLVAHMVALPPAEKKRKPAPMASKQAAKEALSAHVPAPKTEEDKAARLALIRRVAAEKGVPVSPKTEAALCADIGE